ncbi:MAG: short-chain dehydrogenase [Acidimicrobiia bacterium]|nr:MAG: short-chain dehydrogenase [Acidimicrobiia bacterium]
MTSTRPVVQVSDAVEAREGAGFLVRRPFASVDLRDTDPFLLLDEMGPVDYAPGEAKGAPDHPHRGFETVTYVLEGAMEHRDSTGGGGVIGPGDTQWMTAGAGLVHSEEPTPEMLRDGGRMHGLQLWVNLPRAEKMTPPRYQLIEAARVARLERDGVVVRVIAGDVDGVQGPGRTRTPITYAHASLASGAMLDVAWPRDFNALVYVLSGEAEIAGRTVRRGQLAVLGDGDRLRVRAVTELEAMLLGGRPIREPIAWYGPFVMNTKAEVIAAIEDYEAGRLGRIVPSGS